jgi:hypothetical protein
MQIGSITDLGVAPKGPPPEFDSRWASLSETRPAVQKLASAKLAPFKAKPLKLALMGLSPGASG